MTLPIFPRLPNYFPWNHELDTQLRDLWALGLSGREISEKIGCSPHTIHRRSCRLGLTRRVSPDNWPESRIKQLIQLWDAGYSAGVIGGIMGISRNAVLGKRMRLGLSKRRTVSASPRTRKSYSVSKPKVKLPTIKAPPIMVTDMAVLDAANPGIGLMELRITSCRSVLRVEKGGARYCGEPTVLGKSFCAGHCAIYYTPAQSRLRSQAFRP